MRKHITYDIIEITSHARYRTLINITRKGAVMPLTNELERKLRLLRSQKKTLKEIANELNLSRITVSRYLKELNLQRNPIEIPIEDILALYNKNYSINEIANHFNVSHSVIAKALKKENIQFSREKNIKKHFERTHQTLWPSIEQDLNNGHSKVTIAKKYKMRVDSVTRLMNRNNYVKRLTDSLEPLEQAFIEAQDLHGKQRTTRLRYLNAIKNYIKEHQTLPSKSNLAHVLDIAPITVSLYINTYQLNHLVSPTSQSNRIKSVIQLLNHLAIRYELNNRTLLKNKQEIDIWLPDYNLGIDVNPVSTHTIDDPKWGFTSKTHHQDKSLQARKVGIALLHLYDDDFEDSRKWAVLTEQLSSLTKPKSKIGARSCTIKEIDKQTAQDFLNCYHFQGADQSSRIKLGMYHGDKLIGVFTCGKSRYTTHDWELYRYCVNPHYIVHGVFARFMRYFTDHYAKSGENLISYMDLNKRMTVSNIYEREHFDYNGITSPNYIWVQRNTFEYLRRYETTKKHLIEQGYDASKTEREIMRERGFYRVYDAGSLRYSKKL